MNEKNAARMLEAALSGLLEADDPRDAVASAPAEIRPYVQLFADLQAAAIPPASEAFRLALRARLAGQANSRTTQPSTVTPRLQRVAAAGVAALVFGSALQPALARELVEQVRLTLGETVADLVQSAITRVQSPDQDDLTGSENGVAPATSGTRPVAPAPIAASPGTRSDTSAPSSHTTASVPGATEPGPQIPRTIAAAPQMPVTPAPSEVGPGAADRRSGPEVPVSQPPSHGEGTSPAVDQPPPAAQDPAPQPAAEESSALPGDNRLAAPEDTGPTAGPGNDPLDEPRPAEAAGEPADDPPGPPGSLPTQANGGNRDTALARAAESGNKVGWENHGPDIPPGNAPSTPPGQAIAAEAGQGVTPVLGGQAGQPAEPGKPAKTPGSAPSTNPVGAGQPVDTGKPAAPSASIATAPVNAGNPSNPGNPVDTPGNGPKK